GGTGALDCRLDNVTIRPGGSIGWTPITNIAHGDVASAPCQLINGAVLHLGGLGSDAEVGTSVDISGVAPTCSGGTPGANPGGQPGGPHPIPVVVCPPGTTGTPPNCVPQCPTGQYWNGQRCVPNTCPTGQHWDGQRCVPNTCPTGQYWDGQRCVPRCAPAQYWDGQRCVPQCAPGQYWNGDRDRVRTPLTQQYRGPPFARQSQTGVH